MLKHVFLWSMAMLLAGCWDADLRHTLYLEPDGAVTWQLHVTELEIPEDPKEIERRLNELWQGTDPISEALFEMGALSVETVVLREQAPLGYVFQARFPSIEPVLEALFEEIPQLTWQEDWTEQGRILSFRLSEEIGEKPRADFPDVALIGADTRLRKDGSEVTKMLRLSSPEDWTALQIQWPKAQ